MKTKHIILAAVAVFQWCIAPWCRAQGTVTVSIENIRSEMRYLYWEIHVTPTNDWGSGGTHNKKALGDCSWYFGYNASALSDPTLTYASDKVPSDKGYASATGLSGGRVYVDTRFDEEKGTGAGLGLDLGTKYHIYTVRMAIVVPGQGDDLYWDQTNTSVWNAEDQPIEESYKGGRDTTRVGTMVRLYTRIGSAKGIVLCWCAEGDADGAGFHVWRGESEDGTYSRITTAPIPGRGSGSAQQEFEDRNVQAGKNYWYKIEELSARGASSFFGPVRAEAVDPVPMEYTLSKCYPNPFNPSTAVAYRLPSANHVVIRVCDTVGKEVKRLVDSRQLAGCYTAVWDGTGRMEAGPFTQSQKVILMH
jgi:hypothetical protein